MKTLITLLSIIFFVNLTFAQQSGTIIYNETVKLDIELPDNAKAMGINIPKERTSQKVLYFNEKESMYTTFKEAEDTHSFSPSEGAHIEIKMEEPTYNCYKNLNKDEMKEQKEIMGKLFLVEEPLATEEWKFTGKQKKILDYLCQEAVATGKDTVSAWFTSQIPVSNGPGAYGKLPGMILEVNLNNGKRIISASTITLGSYPDGMIEMPKKGKKVSQQEFDEIREEKMKEMQKMYGGSGNVIIQTVGGGQ